MFLHAEFILSEACFSLSGDVNVLDSYARAENELTELSGCYTAEVIPESRPTHVFNVPARHDHIAVNHFLVSEHPVVF